jgi:NADPH-dependent 2,4-dienoyl-CoA reductase/sulfur reductase-like enzyme
MSEHGSIPGSPTADRIRFTVDGAVLEATPGDSIAAAMIAAGEFRFRESRSGSPRGMFCGMGVCGECQVLVDGVSRRACLEKAREGQVVRRHPAKRDLGIDAHAGSGSGWTEQRVDVLVVGAGPAGLSAAIAAATHDLDVLLVDERAQPGGQYFKQPAEEYGIDERRLDAQFREGADLIRRAVAAGVRFLHGATAWGGFDESKVAVTASDGTRLISARRIVLAAGAYERPLPVPGWTLPGAMTTGAVQTLLRAYRTAPAAEVLVAGNGPLNFQVARELIQIGVSVVAVAEVAASPFRSILPVARMAAAGPSLTLEGIRQLAALRAARVPVHYRHALVRIDGKDRVRTATIGRVDAAGALIPGSEIEYSTDVVCMNYGFLPQNDLARSLGCEFHFDPRRAQWTARRDEEFRTTTRNVFLIGDAAGLGGARIAMDEGEVAGLALARDLGAGVGSVPAAVRRRLARHRRFQSALWTVFRAPPMGSRFSAPDTLLCRCEEISRASIEASLSSGCHSLASLKKATRAGMGRCQGRYCGVSLAELGAAHGIETREADSYFAPRPPFKPIKLKDIAGAVGSAQVPVDLLSTTDRYANISGRSDEACNQPGALPGEARTAPEGREPAPARSQFYGES